MKCPPVRDVLRNNGLSLVLLALFLITMLGQWLTGWQTCNEDRRRHGDAAIGAFAYLGTGHFIEATGENWESEFLQMGLFVMLSACLFQKGSPESNDPDEPKEERAIGPDSPWPVRRGGWWGRLYRYSLSLAFLLLFLAAFTLHAIGGFVEHRDDARAHGEAPPTFLGYAGSSQFWFESFQNWQSEFLSLAAMVYLAVWLRHDGSAESKPVAASHDDHE